MMPSFKNVKHVVLGSGGASLGRMTPEQFKDITLEYFTFKPLHTYLSKNIRRKNTLY